MNMDKRLEKNFERLGQEPYTMPTLFRPKDYDWPGDWEGRALLAFCRLYALTGQKLPAMDDMINQLSDKTNAHGYFGAEYDGSVIDEQQLSGHSWYLRGLMAYYELFQSQQVLNYAHQTVHHLFLPALAQYSTYPTDRSGGDGGVYGHIAQTQGHWRLSTDIGCAFIPIDGLAHYYAATEDEELKAPLEQMIDQFMQLDKRQLKMQTHATLTAARGILKFYEAVGEEKYLQYAIDLFNLYTTYGMTATYENYNWFEREQDDIWTEPCAVADSLILALELYRLTQEEKYRVLARRIWFNGLQFCQRVNGGCGPNSCVNAQKPYLKIYYYEAVQCCTMRYSEGLYWYSKYQDLFQWEDGTPSFENGCYMINDWLLAEDVGGTFPACKQYHIDGKTLILIPSLNEVSEQKAQEACLRIVF